MGKKLIWSQLVICSFLFFFLLIPRYLAASQQQDFICPVLSSTVVSVVVHCTLPIVFQSGISYIWHSFLIMYFSIQRSITIVLYIMSALKSSIYDDSLWKIIGRVCWPTSQFRTQVRTIAAEILCILSFSCGVKFNQISYSCCRLQLHFDFQVAKYFKVL